jgi:hypothetical protein
MKGPKGPADAGEGKGVYGKVNVDREDVILANRADRPPDPKNLPKGP